MLKLQQNSLFLYTGLPPAFCWCFHLNKKFKPSPDGIGWQSWISACSHLATKPHGWGLDFWKASFVLQAPSLVSFTKNLHEDLPDTYPAPIGSWLFTWNAASWYNSDQKQKKIVGTDSAFKHHCRFWRAVYAGIEGFGHSLGYLFKQVDRCLCCESSTYM